MVILQLLFTFSLYVLGVLILGLAVFPSLLLCHFTWLKTASFDMSLRILFLCFAAAAGYFIFGITLIFILGFIRIVFRLKLKEGEYTIISIGAMRWAFINAFHLLVSALFMDFILLTPLSVLFYQLMGARVGKNVQINSKYCADMPLLEIGDGAVIGGHATVVCHSFERHKLILRKVKIGKKAIIGINAIILPGCDVGEGAVVAAGAVLPKNTKVEPHSVYFGIKG